MRMKRICRFLLSLAILSQNFCELPANAEKLTETCDFASFSEQVQGIMQAETDRALYTEIVYDPAAGTLSADGGSAQTACGGLYIGEDGTMTAMDSLLSAGRRHALHRCTGSIWLSCIGQ